MKRLSAAVLSLIIAASLTLAAFASAPLIEDNAGLFSEYEISRLESKIAQVKDETGWDAVIATADDTGEYDTRDYSDVMYEQKCADGAVGEDGICFLIDMDAGEFYISTQGDAQIYFTDRRVESLLDECLESYSDEESFYAAADCALDMTLDYYSQGKERGAHVEDEETSVPEESILLRILRALIPSGIVSAIAAAIYVNNIKKDYKMQRAKTASGTTVALSGMTAGFAFADSADELVNTYRTRRTVPAATAVSGSGPAATTHRGPGSGPMGGRMSHGGGGKSFR